MNPFNNPIVRLSLVVIAILSFGGGYFVARKGLPPGVHIPGLATGPAATQDNISCYFSPGGGCTEAIVDELGQARQTVVVQAYSFTSKPIASALIDAARRGVKVTVILDKSCKTEHSEGETLFAAGIPVYVDSLHAIAHNKVMVIDGRTVITGSFNFTNQAEKQNAENLLILRDRPLIAQAYSSNFTEHQGHSAVADEESFHEASKPRSGRGK